MLDVLDFDLWRASKLEEEDFGNTLRQVSIRIGQLAAEDLLDIHVAWDRIIAALPRNLAISGKVRTQVMDDLRVGLLNPAWASYRMSRETWAMPRHS